MGNTWVADWAIDGNTDGVFNNRSVASTLLENEPWLQIALDGPTNIDEAKIYNRTDCCPERLGRAHVFFSNTDMAGRSVADLVADNAVTTFTIRGNPGVLEEFSTGGINATFVKIQLPRTDILTVAEVVLIG